MDKIDPDKNGIIFIIVIFTVLISVIAYLTLDFSTDYPSWIETSELTITDLDFTVGDVSSGKIIIQVMNTGRKDIVLSEIKINNETATSWKGTNSAKVTAGGSETITVTQSIMADTKYSILLFSTEGYIVGSYTKTA